MVSISIKVSIPEKKFASKKWLETIARAQRAGTVRQLKDLFGKTVYGWSKKPGFGWSQIKTHDEIGIQMYAQGEGADVYALLNAGSPPHEIRPKTQGGILSFRPGYLASTTPGQLMSRRAYRSGKFVTARKVNHPGFAPRKFTEMIRDAYINDFAMEMQAAVSEAAKT